MNHQTRPRRIAEQEEEMMNQATRPTAEEIKVTLGLEPHPTCGFVAETYRSPLKIPAVGRCPGPTRATVPTAPPSTSSSPPAPR